MTSCMGGMNSHPSKEVHFNLMNSPRNSLRDKKKQLRLKQRSNSQVFVPIKKDSNFILNKEENNKLQNDLDIKKILQLENIVKNNLNNDTFTKNTRGKSNAFIKKKKLESTEDFCDIIECEDEFECQKSISEARKAKNSDILNEKRVNYLPIQNLIINNIENVKQNSAKKENGGNIIDNRKNQLMIKNYDDKGNKSLKYNNNSNFYKITKPNNISFTDKNERSLNKINENNNIQSYYENIKNSNKKNKDYNSCKIDNNISFNINNSNIMSNNNNLNSNMIMNNFNNISSINSDFNNNNYIDISGNMTYILSLDKSQQKPSSTRFEKKNLLSLNNNNNPITHNNNSSYIKDSSNNNDRNSLRVNKYKWKLLPKHKYNTQIYKSIMNIPNNPLSYENPSLLMNEEEKKNLSMTNIATINNKNENSFAISEIKKQKEEQDKIIKSLENKIKSLENKIKTEENIIKNNEKKMKQINTTNNKLAESQKDFRIKKLEEQLTTVRKNNKLNKNLLKRKDEQIKNLIDKKNKQEQLIKKYEISKNIKQKNSYSNSNGNLNFTTKATIKEINYVEDLSKSYNYNNFITNNSNSNLHESKMSFQNLNYSINAKSTKNINKKKSLNKNMKHFHKKEESINIKKQSFLNNSVNLTNLEEYFNLDPEIEHKRINSSMRETIKHSNLINRSSSNISYNKYCKDLCHKNENNYNNKVTSNKKKIYKLNKSTNNLSINHENKMNIFQKPTKKGKKQNKNKKEEENQDLNIKKVNSSNNSTNKKHKKKFSFTKSKKFLKKTKEKDLKEMYLQAGTAQNEEISTINHNIYTNSDLKLFTHNDLLLITHKNSFTNSGGDTTATNKNINGITMSLDDKLNSIDNINNINMFNPYLKSISNEQIEKSETLKIYQNLWNEGYLRYKQLTKEKKVFETKSRINYNFWKLNFCMANDLIELRVDKKDLMLNIKNKFLSEFFRKKYYGENEKKYIKENIIFLNRDGIININKKIFENNLFNNDVIIPVLKDMT